MPHFKTNHDQRLAGIPRGFFPCRNNVEGKKYMLNIDLLYIDKISKIAFITEVHTNLFHAYSNHQQIDINKLEILNYIKN